MHGTLTERITRSLAYMLRHQPEEFDLDLDDEGWGEMEEIVLALNERLGEPIEEEDVVEALDGGDRQRYEVKDDRIRALYGHSFHVEPGESVEPPEFLYVGLGSRDAMRAEEHGLRPTRRSFVHLALNEQDAKETGKRTAPEYAVLKIDALEAWEEGIEFYDRISLYLSEEIPAEFLESSEVYTDGIRRHRGGRDGGDRDRGGRGRGRGSRRGGGRGRGDSDDRASRSRRPERDEESFEEPAARSESRDESRRESRSEPRAEEKPESRAEAQPERKAQSKPEKKPEKKPVKARSESKPKSSNESEASGFGAGLL